MTVDDLAVAARQREGGFKGDGGTITLPADNLDAMLGRVTGLDSVGLLSLPGGKWYRGDRVDSILIYTDRRTLVRRCAPVMAATTLAPIDVAANEGVAP